METLSIASTNSRCAACGAPGAHIVVTRACPCSAGCLQTAVVCARHFPPLVVMQGFNRRQREIAVGTAWREVDAARGYAAVAVRLPTTRVRIAGSSEVSGETPHLTSRLWPLASSPRLGVIDRVVNWILAPRLPRLELARIFRGRASGRKETSGQA